MFNNLPFFLFRMLVLPPLVGVVTWYLMKIGFTRQMGAVDTIFFGGIFFSFAITLNTVNVRRFQAIDEIAKLWAVSMSLWHTAQRNLSGERATVFQNELRQFFEKLRFFLHIDTVGEESENKLADIDKFFHVYSLTIEELRQTGLNSPEIARLLGWMEEMYFGFEKLRAIKENRTPKSLRIFIDWALVTGVFLLTPQFASLGSYGIGVAVIVMIVLLVLIKVQKMLEHPFGKDMDDIDLRLREKARQRISTYNNL